MENIMFKAWVKAQMVKQSAKEKAAAAKEHLMSEEGGADTIIIAVIVIILVLAIGFIFRDAIIGWFNSLMTDANSQMESASNMPSIVSGS